MQCNAGKVGNSGNVGNAGNTGTPDCKSVVSEHRAPDDTN